ncbi:hypothetical protein EYF80_031670 [Liparis tanakae]|uniref:Uncharacterized protein n=1 Tax=Liparis tanakae TaxID=230148 RepID=A0A4Z2GWX4_9TELE|nr:hypothetical protein EYF80_031670 [Liparis tanakae]
MAGLPGAERGGVAPRRLYRLQLRPPLPNERLGALPPVPAAVCGPWRKNPEEEPGGRTRRKNPEGTHAATRRTSSEKERPGIYDYVSSPVSMEEEQLISGLQQAEYSLVKYMETLSVSSRRALDSSSVANTLPPAGWRTNLAAQPRLKVYRTAWPSLHFFPCSSQQENLTLPWYSTPSMPPC